MRAILGFSAGGSARGFEVTPPFMRRIALLCCAAAAVWACGDEENTSGLPTKADYELSATEIAHDIGLISIHLPHLEVPKADGKYDPRPTARDVQPRQERAANAIRMAATSARQRGKSPVTKKLLGDALAEVSRKCMRAEGDKAVAACKDAVSALDVELEKQSKAASDAGATNKMPRIGPAAITAEVKKEFEPFLKALGPTPKEVVVLKALGDPKADIEALMMDCDAAAEEQKAVEETYTGVDEELRKLAVKHRFAIEAICRVVKRIEASRLELTPCEKDDKKKEPECVLACSKGKGLIDEGMPTAAQENFREHYKAICEADD